MVKVINMSDNKSCKLCRANTPRWAMFGDICERCYEKAEEVAQAFADNDTNAIECD